MKRQVLCLVAALLAVSSVLHAEDKWPTRPVHIIVPAPAGGGSEIFSRRIAAKLEPALGQPVVVETKPGGGGSLGAAIVAKAPADGYTLLFGHVGIFAMQPHMMKSLPYDPLKDLVAVSRTAISPMLILVNSAVPVKDLKELVALAKRRPGSISASSTGVGSPSHIAIELLQQLAGLKLNHIAYKGSAPALVDLAGGQVQMGFDYNVVAAPHIKSGKLRALAVTSPQRVPSMPDVPTVGELGYPDLQIDTWTGIFVPAGTSPVIVERLNRELVKALNAEDMRARVAELGSEVAPTTSTEFTTLIRADHQRWGKVIQAAHITIEE